MLYYKGKGRYNKLTNNIDNTPGRNNRDELGHFLPGNVANPGGRPSEGPSLTKVLREYLLEHPQDLLDILIATIDAAKRGKFEHLNLIWNRLDGKLIETHQIESENPVTLVFVPADTIKRVENTSEPPVLEALDTETVPDYGGDEINATSEVLEGKKTGLAMLPAPRNKVQATPAPDLWQRKVGYVKKLGADIV